MAEQLSPKQLNDLGDAYFTGTGKVQNKELAYTYYKQAADLDNPLGHLNIGRYFLDKGDYKKATDALLKAKSYRYTPALLLLASMAKNGQGMKRNKTKAFKFMLEASELGDVDAVLEVAESYETGYGIKKDPEKAFAYYQKAADQNHPKGFYKVGTILLQNAKEKSGGETAIAWLDKAATAGEPMAMRTLIRLFETSGVPYLRKKSVSYCKEMAFYYHELLARTGDDVALRLVANAYFYGDSLINKNADKAALYYTKLSEMNDPIGYFGLGQCYAVGFGVKIDTTKSRAFLEKAAEGGHPQAMSKLGDLHRLNAKSIADYETAKQFYTEAAKQNDLDAIINLGLLHYRNQIANASGNLAFQYFDSAAKKGAPGAWYWLGVLYQKGDGVAQNLDQARKNYLKAIASGHLGAKFKLATMFEEEALLPKLKPKAKTALYEQTHRLYLEYSLDPSHNQANHLISMRRLGMYFETGLSGSKNPRAARYWYESAASENDPEAMLWMYRELKTRESEAALRWLDMACRDEHFADAHYEKGLLYLEGFAPFVKIDLKAARLEFEIAARENHPSAVAKLMLL
jgi:uncharacterized protein